MTTHDPHKETPSIVWLRDDLRVADNPALTAAIERGGSVVMLYLLDEVSPGIRPLGGASRWWLHHSLAALGASIEALGGTVTLRSGAAAEVLPALVDEVGASAVFWNRRYGASREIDATLKASLRESGVTVQSFQANLLFEPWTITTQEGAPYRVFTPFWRACLASGEPREPLEAPRRIPSATPTPASDDLDDWMLLPTRPDWAAGLRAAWTPGEAGAADLLDDFADRVLADYHRRDEPGHESTSRLSPHLRFGEISPFQVWERLRAGGRAGGSQGGADTSADPLSPAARKNAAKFLSEIGWREFNANILFHFVNLATDNFRPEFDAFPWEQPRATELEAWQKGRTGIPMVDAGMRELWTTGYMHNRVRMIAASFLIKNLLVDWRVGEAWFWDTLVDADEGSNPGNWQWVAGSGADAAPYFRVFNPELQAKKFDPDGTYVNRWLPPGELSPMPIVDLAASRAEALAAYEAMRKG